MSVRTILVAHDFLVDFSKGKNENDLACLYSGRTFRSSHWQPADWEDAQPTSVRDDAEGRGAQRHMGPGAVCEQQLCVEGQVSLRRHHVEDCGHIHRATCQL